MARPTPLKKAEPPPEPKGITKITVAGFKSLREEQSIEIRPLTILAGANSSGKSSIMQPLLLLKQTLEASYDPGPLRLDGPNVRFTSAEQFLSHTVKDKYVNGFHAGIVVGDGTSVTTYFQRQLNSPLEVKKIIYSEGDEEIILDPDMSLDEIKLNISEKSKSLLAAIKPGVKTFGSPELDHFLIVSRKRCFLALALHFPFDDWEDEVQKLYIDSHSENIERYIRKVIHVPGLRGNPERTYLVAAVGSTFPGTFENYVASVIAKWQAEDNNESLEGVSQDLKELGLTWKVSATPLNDTQVELRVARMPQVTKGRTSEMVSIADVGFGVSQILPVLVALRIARPGQLVYLEQPELHLHPRAQTALAKVLADAARRGVHVVAETHSSLLILGIQTLVAEGKLAPDLVKLHWFERQDGATKIRSADLDEKGSFGDWPEDFADVELEAQSKYLDAVEARVTEKKRRAG